MTEDSNDRPPPPLLPASESPLPSLLAKLADIPEEEIWLAKQKSKRTRRAYKLDVRHFMRMLHITTYEELRRVTLSNFPGNGAKIALQTKSLSALEGPLPASPKTSESMSSGRIRAM
jgi:hypothetical protein